MTPSSVVLMTYRQEIRHLDSLATPAPWLSEGEWYGVHEEGLFMALGFAPHRPLDSRLIAVYRSAVIRLLEAVDAVERLALRASANTSVPAAIGIHQVLTILDATEGAGTPFRSGLVELDLKTTPPLWDPGHLVLGLGFAPKLCSLGVATPQLGDAPLIAVSRIAVPRALELLALTEQNIAQHALVDGRLRSDGAAAIVSAVVAFDAHSASDGSGTGTV